MVTPIQQTMLLIESMGNLELQCIEQLVRTKLESIQQRTARNLECKLLQIPKELRDQIYFFVGIHHLQYLSMEQKSHQWISTTHPLLHVNQQIRQEFGEFSSSPHMVRAAYLDDTERDRERWRPVPMWLFRALLAAPRSEDGFLEWDNDKLNLSKLDRETVKDEVRRAVFKDRQQDPDIRREARAQKLANPGAPRMLDIVNNSDAHRFHGFLELAGKEHRSPILATLSFEKFLLSEDQWFKVPVHAGFERESLFVRNRRYRKHGVTMEQRYRARDSSNSTRLSNNPLRRAKTRQWPRLVTDGKSAGEGSGLDSNEVSTLSTS